ncbi:hypothetical protein C8R46DRAFT_1189554 [Mycena filopes]|nr:hypothetical protein C8R46DRAFT_1189554 [Mycena filopes]
MADPDTLIVFGSSPESFYIGHGRRHFVENMPEGFTNHAKTALNISMTLFVSVSKSLNSWVTYNVATANFHFNANIEQDIRDHMSGVNGKSSADFVTFPDTEDPKQYFVKGKNEGVWNAVLDTYFLERLTALQAGKNEGVWNAVLDTYFLERLTALQAEVPNFDVGLTGMLFGKGKTFICLFKGGFYADVDDEVASDDHPLYKVLKQYDEGWCIDRASTLCLYDSRYFFLKFKQPGQTQTKLHWNLPPDMGAKLAQLREQAQLPEEQIARMQEDQMWVNVAQTRMGQMQINDMLNQQIHRAGLSMLAAATGGTIVETVRYY